MGIEIYQEDFLKDLMKTDFDEICEEALNEASPILEKSFKDELRKVITHQGDSETVTSVKTTKAKKSKNGAWIVNVRPTGNSKKQVTIKGVVDRKKPISNAFKAVLLEYGVPGKRAPRPFLAKATRSAETQALKKVQEVYERKVGVK